MGPDPQQQASTAAQAQQNIASQQATTEQQYIAAQQQALRNQILGLMSNGNPYFQAASQVTPTSSAPPTLGGQVYGGGSATPMNGAAAPTVAQATSTTASPSQGNGGPTNANQVLGFLTSLASAGSRQAPGMRATA
jgi:hypothetical protein